MVISDNTNAPIQEFSNLMCTVDELLNYNAKEKPDYYRSRNGIALEEDVYNAMLKKAHGTIFDGTIKLVSGAKFPDIIANDFLGVEVKSTKSDSWKTIGSSILESTRAPKVEKIFLTFGRLGNDVQFLTRPYEECLSGIAVTHYPRYQIDMQLRKGETIFDKMNRSYEDLRKLDNPLPIISEYYEKNLRAGQHLWWLSENNFAKQNVSPIVRFFSSLEINEKEDLMTEGMARFPEIFRARNANYERFVVWMATSKGVLSSCVRDIFSAGGIDGVPQEIKNEISKFYSCGVIGRLYKYRDTVKDKILKMDRKILEGSWSKEIKNDNLRLHEWMNLVISNLSHNGLNDENELRSLLEKWFID